jgi:hypothetical protein
MSDEPSQNLYVARTLPLGEYCVFCLELVTSQRRVISSNVRRGEVALASGDMLPDLQY